MIYLKWFLFALIDYACLIPPAWYVWVFIDVSWWMWLPPFHTLAVFVSLFTAKGWGAFWWMGTFDNPPQGDNGWITKRCPYPNEITGWKGYWNRVRWLWRNPNYEPQRLFAVPYNNDLEIVIAGNPDISDKYAISGWYFARAYDPYLGGYVAFEIYCIFPYPEKLPVLGGKCFRLRWGWKVMTKKFKELGFAQLVDTITPVKEYGESV